MVEPDQGRDQDRRTEAGDRLWEAGRNWNLKWDAEPPHYPKCFKVTTEGHPWHPLYLSNATLDAFKDFIP